MIRYGTGLVKWTEDKLRIIEDKGNSNVQNTPPRLYIPSSNGGKGMISVEDCKEMETENLKKCVKISNERLLNVVEREEIPGGGRVKKEVLNKLQCMRKV